MSLFDYPWHDAIIKEIHIDRSNPGNSDEIVMIIIWPDDKESTVRFTDVYYAQLSLNFGVIADECISDVDYISNEDKDVVTFLDTWRGVVDNLEKLLFIKITTRSTSSLIKIFARKMVIKLGRNEESVEK